MMEIKNCGEGDCENGALIRQLQSDRAGDQQRLFHYERVIAQMQQALKPFADFADRTKQLSSEYVITTGSRMAKRQLTMGDCYAAYNALHRDDERVP
jgi:hypothetical protein